MSPRAESLGFEHVHAYVAGKTDWVARGCRSRARTEARHAPEPTLGPTFRHTASTIACTTFASNQTRAAGTPASSSNDRHVVLGRIDRRAIRGRNADSAAEAMTAERDEPSGHHLL